MQPLSGHTVVRYCVDRYPFAEVGLEDIHAHAQQRSEQPFEPSHRFGVGHVNDAHWRMKASSPPQVGHICLALGSFQQVALFFGLCESLAFNA